MSAIQSEIGGGIDAALAQEEQDRTPRLVAVGGILAALGAASCCVIPFALFLAGVSGAWIGNLTALEPYQPAFAGASLTLVGYGAWRLRRKREAACASGYCATPRSDRIAKTGLWAAAVLVAIAVIFPYAARSFL
ncbi:MAG: mercury transporter MerT [Hyphomicrobiales bacterium]|nr:mercury transporter MerT [Hyphomicrobiales bacterium]HRY04202.1 mercuric transporter MerT family protein [Beijerinckiaceae bacterium]